MKIVHMKAKIKEILVQNYGNVKLYKDCSDRLYRLFEQEYHTANLPPAMTDKNNF